MNANHPAPEILGLHWQRDFFLQCFEGISRGCPIGPKSMPKQPAAPPIIRCASRETQLNRSDWSSMSNVQHVFFVVTAFSKCELNNLQHH